MSSSLKASTYPLNRVGFPVVVGLRNPNVRVQVMEDGRVLALCSNRESSMVIARCEPSKPGFDAFLSFWALTFPAHSKTSLALTQLVMDLAAGRIEQDPDCPHLFFDKCRADTLRDGSLIYPLLEVTGAGLVREYNPDTYYLNESYALANNTGVKFFPLIEDFEGNDVMNGMLVGVSLVPGERPSFDAVSREVTAAALESAINANRLATAGAPS